MITHGLKFQLKQRLVQTSNGASRMVPYYDLTKLECLHGRKVAVIPDADAPEEWKAKMQPLIHIAPFEFSSFCETVLQELGKKGDVADYLIEKLKV